MKGMRMERKGAVRRTDRRFRRRKHEKKNVYAERKSRNREGDSMGMQRKHMKIWESTSGYNNMK